MLKNLKKGGKDQAKKEPTKEKKTKNEPKKVKEQEEQDTNLDLVDINYDQKETAVKTVKKAQTSKLDEKEIDTSNIVIEKKEEKKVLTSWIVQESKIKDLLRADFNAKEHQTEFVSLTDEKINKELEEKAKKDALENKPKIVEIGGLKMAPLQNMERGKDLDLVITKNTQNTSLIGSIPVKQVVFTNSAQNVVGNFAPLEKTPQQLKEQQLELKQQNRQPEVVVPKGKSAWIGVKANEVKAPPIEFKVSGWAAKSNEISQPATKFAPLQKSEQDKKAEQNYSRRQQQFVFTNKKQVEQKRRLREEAAKKAETKE